MMKRGLVILLAGFWGMTAGAYVPSLLIDDFADGNLSEYVLTCVLDQNTARGVSFTAAGGVLRVTKSSGTEAEQVVLLRDDYSLAVGDLLVVDLAWGTTTRADIGIAVAATKTPPALASGTSGDVRQDYIAVYVQADNNNLKGVVVNGTTVGGTIYAGGLPADPKVHVTGLYIRRDSANTFALGYIVDKTTYVDFSTATIANTNIGNAVGFFGDVRSVTTYGDVDNLRIESSLFGPHNPDPANNATQVGIPIGTTGDVDVMLQWDAGLNPANRSQINPLIKKHYVYLSKNQNTTSDPNLYYAATVNQVGGNLTSSYIPEPALKASGKYLWRIEHALDNGQGGVYPPGEPNNIVGPTWTFETISMEPIIQTQPVSTLVRLGQSLSPAFSVSVFSVSPVSYQWYYSADNQIDASDTQVGGNSPTLSILNASVSNQGHYYCRIWNEATQSGGGPQPDVYTNVVSLTVGRLVAAYGFENNLNDTSGENNHGQAFDLSLPDPSQASLVFTTDHIQGSYALQLNGVGQYVDFGMSAYPKAGPLAGGIGGGLDEGTITCWVKASKVGGLLTNYNDGTTTGFAMSLETSGTTADARINVRGEAAEIVTAQGRPGMTGFDMLTDNQWHMVTTVWKAGTIGRVYVDGGIVAEDTTLGTPALYAAWQRGVLLGATRTFADRNVLANFYGGLIDDLRVYNYAWTPAEIAAAYTQVTGKPACVNPNFDGSQFNFDNTAPSYCRIDLADFAAFASRWLADGLY
ncbi:MAG TPA: immunoglobulin domain-containing protein [Anaerohalosphaeraceae bacterium]|nr:immunoglobulin domain-containing protein [Anaerohalosphaeraceae bacterium]HPP56194.1 immunoglobulin domain-containing protein [Anaerohalosphaeraceae bacterium]